MTGGGEGLGVGVRDGVLLGGVSGASMKMRGGGKVCVEGFS